MTENPLISVIVPTCNRNDLLAKMLECIKPALRGTLAERCEVIVSDDSTKNSARAFLEAQYPWVRCVEGPHRGPAANRNCGAKKAQGQWLVFVDDDCIPEASWLPVVVQAAESGKYDVIEGKTISDDNGDDPFKHYVENLSGGLYWSCNLAISKESFDSLGGFDEDFLEAGGEDMEFAYRIGQSHLRTVFVPEAIVVHPARSLTFKSFLWRTLLARWQLLYRLKTGQGASLSVSLVEATFSLFVDLCVDLLRTTWHLFSKPHSSRRRKQVFDQFWKWFTFPVMVPYLILWELRFRKLLKDRGN
jgi:GT2 family glycosyltransferase